MSLSQDEIQEFEVEAAELLDSAEQCLLAIEQGEPFPSHYDSIFRVFHSLKGAAGMMDLIQLQGHMHQLENILSELKSEKTLERPVVDFFLRGTDVGRRILRGETVPFDYEIGKTAGEHSTPPPSSSEPVAAPPAPEPTFAASPAPTPATATRGQSPFQGKVFVIDDEPELAALLHQILQEAGLEVTSYTDASQALADMDSGNPDLVVTDLTMPGIDGMEVLKRIRSGQKDTPVIFVSGHVDKNSALQAISLGVYSVIEKPFNIAHVIESCVNACRKHQLSKLFRKSLRLIMYQFSDLDAYLEKQNKHDVRQVIRREIESLIERQKDLDRLTHPPKPISS